MTRSIIIFFLSLCSVSAIAQECTSCKAHLQYFIAKVEANYIGFPDKITPEKTPAYRQFKDSLLQLVDTASLPSCLTIMKKYAAYFHENHLFIYPNRLNKNPLVQQNFPTPAALANAKPGSLDATFKIIDKKTCLITIPSGRNANVAIVDSLMDTYKDVLSKTEHLIVDIRQNRGGSVLPFERLIPYLYTNPIVTEGAMVLATDDNITNAYERIWPGTSDSMQAVFTSDAKKLRAHQGTVYQLWDNDTFRLKEVMPYPKRVSILIDTLVASSAEMFVLKARQSKKVKFFGTHTTGAVDYSDAVPFETPCSIFNFVVASSRTLRMPAEIIDNIGIKPHVEIPKGTDDWVKYVSEYAK